MLTRSPFLEVVGIAGDGEEALNQVKDLQPDVVTLDLIMPGLDGFGFLEQQMASSPVPVVVVSGAGDQSDEIVRKAMDAGAVEFVHKASMSTVRTLLQMSEELISKV